MLVIQKLTAPARTQGDHVQSFLRPEPALHTNRSPLLPPVRAPSAAPPRPRGRRELGTPSPGSRGAFPQLEEALRNAEGGRRAGIWAPAAVYHDANTNGYRCTLLAVEGDHGRLTFALLDASSHPIARGAYEPLATEAVDVGHNLLDSAIGAANALNATLAGQLRRARFPGPFGFAGEGAPNGLFTAEWLLGRLSDPDRSRILNF